MGTDSKAYVTPEEMEDQHLRIKDMRLHTMLHMAGVYMKTRNEAKVYKDDEERTLQTCFKTEKDGNTKTSDGKELEDHHDKLKGSAQKVGHYVHNGNKWIRQQGETQPMIENLHIEVDKSGYENMGFPKPSNTHPQVVCGLADTRSRVMVIGPELVKRFGVKETEMISLSMDVKGVDSMLMEVAGGIPVKLGLNLDNGGNIWET